jgi:hypothetical protein
MIRTSYGGNQARSRLKPAGGRIGLVQMGQGGSALDYTFDADGLSNDSRLPTYMQSLTPAQLQVALNPDPSGDLTLQESISSHDAYIASGVNCDDTGCGNNLPTPSVPLWVWIAGGGLVAITLFRR